MNKDSVQDSTRYVVSEVHHGSVLPGTRMEMGRDVFLLSGADVRGGVWCGTLTVTGPNINVTDSVYCRGAIAINNNDGSTNGNQDVKFGSCVTSPDSLIMGELPFKVRFLSDIYTGQLNLSNAFVYGNIFTRQAIIRNSIVLGGIFCKGRLKIESSFISTFETGNVEIGKNVSIFFPSAIARKPIELQYPVRVLTFYNLHQLMKGEKDMGSTVNLDDNDIFKISLPKGSSGEQGETNDYEDAYCLSITERILDSESVAKHLTYNRQFLKYLALGSNLDPSVKSSIFDKPMAELEKVLWETLDTKNLKGTSNPSVSIEDLFKRFDEYLAAN